MFTAEIEEDYINILADKRVMLTRYKKDAVLLADMLPFKLICLLEVSKVVTATEVISVSETEVNKLDDLFYEDNFE